MPSKARGLCLAAALVLATVTLVSLADTLLQIARCYSNVPWRDEWVFLDEYRRVLAGEPIAPILWLPHYGHRPVIPRLIIYANAAWFHYARWPLLLLMLVCQVGLFAVMARLLYLRLERRVSVTLLAAIPVLHLLATPQQMENFVWGMQFAFLIS